MIRQIAALAATALFATATPAAVIDFDSLAFDGGPGTPSAKPLSFVVGDYIFTSMMSGGFDRPFDIYARNDPRNTDVGGAALGYNWTFVSFTFARTDGTAFDFTSYDVTFARDSENGPNTGGGISFFFNGSNIVGGSSVFDNQPGFQTFAIGGIGVSSVRVVCNNNCALDNLIVSGGAPIPESATWAMMIVGFGLVGGALRRRASGTARRAVRRNGDAPTPPPARAALR